MALPVNKRVLKILFILLVVAFCVYLVPRVAINFFYYPDDKIYGPDPGRRNPSNLRLRTVLVCKAGLFLLRRALLTTPSQPSFMLTAMPEICPPTGRWSVGYPSVISTFLCLIIAGLVNQRHAVPAGLLDDTQSAINVVRHRSDVNPQRLVLFGQSIGGANILAVIGQGNREGIRAVILDSTFASYATIANQMIPGSGYLLDESYSGENYIASVSPIPLLLIHGKADHVIPWQHSEKLYSPAKEPKRLILIPDGEHIDAFSDRHGDVYREQMVDFILSALNPQN